MTCVVCSELCIVLSVFSDTQNVVVSMKFWWEGLFFSLLLPIEFQIIPKGPFGANCWFQGVR